MASIRSLFVFSLYSLLAPAVNAQIGFRRRTHSIGRIVAGCVVGGVVLIFLLCLLCMMMRKRRARAQYARRNPGAPIPGNLNGWTPVAIGAPFNRFGMGSRRDPYQDPQNFPQSGPQTSNFDSHNAPVSAPHTSMTNNNPEYPPTSAPLPPPAYGKDANYGGTYNPPPGAPPNTSQNAAPPIPPPTAYTGPGGNHKDTNNFVGGFRA